MSERIEKLTMLHECMVQFIAYGFSTHECVAAHVLHIRVFQRAHAKVSFIFEYFENV